MVFSLSFGSAFASCCLRHLGTLSRYQEKRGFAVKLVPLDPFHMQCGRTVLVSQARSQYMYDHSLTR